MEWNKKVDARGNQKEEHDITVKKLFKRFEEYCLSKNNLVVERRKFFWKNQHDDETFDQFMIELRNLASTCEYGDLHESLLLYKVVDGIRSDKIRDILLRKGVEMTLEKTINICRTEEITKMQMKEMNSEKEEDGISRLKTENGRRYRRNRSHILKTEIDEDRVMEISDDDDEKETSEEFVTLKDVKREESE